MVSDVAAWIVSLFSAEQKITHPNCSIPLSIVVAVVSRSALA